MRRGNIFWGLVLILIAALLLLKQLGVIEDFFGYLWVFVPLLVGIWLIVSALTRPAPTPTEHIAVSLANAARARIQIDHGAGRLTLSAGAAPGNLLEGECSFGALVKNTLEGDLQKVKVKHASNLWAWAPGESLDWKLKLAKDIPLMLDIDTGAATCVLDLREVQVEELDLDTGASTTDLTLPAEAGLTRVKIDAGAATLRVVIPQGVAAQIRVESGMAAVSVDGRFPKVGPNLYLSPDYASAAHRADIRIEAGMASVEIK